MRRPTRAALAAALALAAAAAPAAAAPPTPATMADRLADRWAGLQREDATFPDSIRPGTHDWGRYGESGVGYGLILAGVRVGRPEWVQAGASAQAQAAGDASDRLSVFESMMLASGYNLLRTRAPATPAFAARRDVWERYLREVKPVYNARLKARDFASNKYLPEAVASLELARSGLESEVPGAILARRGEALRRGLYVLNRLLPARVAAVRGRTAGHRVSGLSDRGRQPLAYHALVTGLATRALDLAGPRASRRARRAVRIGVRSLWAFQAPDGDVAYFGRSQGQSWALGFAAYAARRAAGGGCGARARDFRAVAARAMSRLGALHPLRDGAGMAIVPAADGPATVAAIDDYASEVVYNGLTMTALGWAAERAEHARGCRAAGGPLSDRRRAAAILPFERSRFATVRRGRVWLAVKRGATGRDPRAGFGLRALKFRPRGGSWVDLLPATPAVGGTEPALLRSSGPPAQPRGARLRVVRGAVVVDGGWIDTAGRWVRRGVFRFAPTARGVRVTLPARRGDRIVFPALFGAQPELRPRGAAGPAASVRFSGTPAVLLAGPFASSSSLAVWRADLAVPARGRRVAFAIRAR